MATVVIALGSNLGDPHSELVKAKKALSSFSTSGSISSSSIYQSEPVGPSETDFLNAVVSFETDLEPQSLFEKLKDQEKKQGRPSRYPKWVARTIDLDIIAYDNLVLQTDSLIIPHSEYTKRLFVLLPLKDVFPEWVDPVTSRDINDLIKKAPEIRITKSKLNW